MLNMLFWNVRGVSRAPNLKCLRNLIKLYSVQLVAICEPKMALAGIDGTKLKLGMGGCVANMWGSIWIFYQSFFRCLSVGESNQHLTVQLQFQLFPIPVCFSFAHAS